MTPLRRQDMTKRQHNPVQSGAARLLVGNLKRH
jgi:hypothetical protein